jgi:hypothetical protein
VVRTVTFTGVELEVPADIVAGLNEQLVSAGRFEQPKLTAEVKAVPPTGDAMKL